ncbi:MAG TPA: SGNH/GDSL hydrolase family protein, partial [Pseudonocardiaceae bacterium]|nr:SGNH/GDSL hydrolase family protein [Pseudonocardiaceae bacterium]
MRISLGAVAVLLAAGLAVPSAAAVPAASPVTRTATWGPSMTIDGPDFTNETIRMVVHTTIGGSSVRIKLSNLRSTTPLSVGEVDVATQAHQATAVPGSRHLVTFSHARTVTIPAGAEVFSDPVNMTVAPQTSLLVSLYVPQATSSSTWHYDAYDTTYLSEPGDHAADVDDGNYVTATTAWYYLSGVDVVAPAARGTVVAFGDSITDGYNTPNGAYATWPDDLSRRLAGTNPLGVVNAGIGGNRVLTDVPPPNIYQGISAIKRFGHDALGQPGVRDVILLEGINDIGNDAGPNGTALTAQDLIDGYLNLIGQAHAAGVRIIGATILPDFGAGYYSAAHEAIRQAVNTWIRTSGAFDGVIDFDKAVQDPANPGALNPVYDSGDHLHPNAAGMQA